MSRRQLVSSAALFLLSAAFCMAQNIAPAHSGTVHYFEGDVSVDGVKLVSQVARFTDLKEQSVLQTGMGRAEILLTPGVLLRVGENSSVKMLDNRLISTRVEFVSGVSMLEAVDSGTTIKDPPVTIVYKDFEAQPVRFGVFEMKSQPSQVRVFKGEAKVTGNGTSLNVKEGNQVDMTTVMAMAKFDAKEGDDLYLWSRDRSAYLSAGNMSSARALATSGYGNTVGCGNGMGYAGTGYGMGAGYGMGYGAGVGYGAGYNNAMAVNASCGWNPAMWNGFAGGWYYNPYLGMYSYLPFAGTIYSPFGYGFYNPVTIAYAYNPAYYWSGAGGARTGATTGVPLQTLPTTSSTPGSGNKPALPRLGTTASLRPSLGAPARGTELGSATASLSAARNTVGGSGSGGGTSGTAARASTPTATAAPAASAGRASAGKR